MTKVYTISKAASRNPAAASSSTMTQTGGEIAEQCPQSTTPCTLYIDVYRTTTFNIPSILLQLHALCVLLYISLFSRIFQMMSRIFLESSDDIENSLLLSILSIIFIYEILSLES